MGFPNSKLATIALCALVFLFVCGASNAAAAEAAGMGIDRLVDVDGVKLRLQCTGAGERLVVIEAGMGEPPVESGSWGRVVAGVAPHARVCLYDRAGLGSSAKPNATPRRLADLESDLSGLLQAANLHGPYILVGHSLGAFVVRAFAARHPESVEGLVLVDASHPDQWARWLASLPAQRPSEPESVSRGRAFLTAQIGDPGANPENIDLARAAADVKRLAPIDSIPLVVLTHSPEWRMAPDLPDHVLANLEAISQELQASLATLSNRSEQRISKHGGHNLQSEDPALVIEAIVDLVRR